MQIGIQVPGSVTRRDDQSKEQLDVGDKNSIFHCKDSQRCNYAQGFHKLKWVIGVLPVARIKISFKFAKQIWYWHNAFL